MLAKNDLFFKLLLAFVFGIVMSTVIGFYNVYFALIFFSICFIFFCFIVLIKKILKKDVNLNFKRFFLVCLFIFLGWTRFFCHYFFTIMPANEFNLTRQEICGVVKDIEHYEKGEKAYILDIVKIADKNFIFPFKLKLYSKLPIECNYGDLIFARALISKQRHGKFNHIFSSNYAKKIYFKSKDVQGVLVKHSFSFLSIFLKLRDSFIETIDLHVRSPESSVINGILFGKSNNMPHCLKRAVNRCGLAHIFCVSGLHISILSSLLFFIFNMLKFPKKLSLILMVFVFLFFLAVNGFAASLVRACLMSFSQFMGIIFKKRVESLPSLVFAAVGILIVTPVAVLGLSFILSFSSCLGIVLFSRKITNWLIKNLNFHSCFKIFIAENIAVSFSAIVISLPFMILNFSQISIVAPVMNLFILPFIVPIVLFSGLTIASGLLLPFCADFFGYFCEGISGAIVVVISRIAEFSFCCLPTGYFFVTLMVLGALIFSGISFFYYRKFLLSRSFVFFCFLIFCIPVVVFKLLTFNFGNFYVIGTGFGFSSVFNFKGKTILFNCGGGSMAGKKLCEFLDSKGVNKIDCIIFNSVSKSSNSDVFNILSEFSNSNIVIPKKGIDSEILDFATSKKINIISDENINLNFGEFSLKSVFKKNRTIGYILNFDGINYAILHKFKNLDLIEIENSIDFAIVGEFGKPYKIALKNFDKMEGNLEFIDSNEVLEFTVTKGKLKRGSF